MEVECLLVQGQADMEWGLQWDHPHRIVWPHPLTVTMTRAAHQCPRLPQRQVTHLEICMKVL